MSPPRRSCPSTKLQFQNTMANICISFSASEELACLWDLKKVLKHRKVSLVRLASVWLRCDHLEDGLRARLEPINVSGTTPPCSRHLRWESSGICPGRSPSNHLLLQSFHSRTAIFTPVPASAVARPCLPMTTSLAETKNCHLIASSSARITPSSLTMLSKSGDKGFRLIMCAVRADATSTRSLHV